MDKKTNFENRFKPPVDVTKHRHRIFDLSKIKSTLFRKPPKKRLMIVAGSSIGLLTLGIAGLAVFGPKPTEPNPIANINSTYTPPVPTTVASPLTGVQVSLDLAKRPVTGVMIENSIDARPQSGLLDAGVVFEAIAEGGITRFLALFQEAQPDYIGPIRSARPYYVRWAAGFDAAYTHSGGSGEALSLIQSLGIKDMDHGNYGNAYFERVSNRYAPHDVYTSMARLDELRASKGYTTSSFTPFARITETSDTETKKDPVDTATETTPTDPAATSISFAISGLLYNTKYSYNLESKSYDRVMANQPHNDERSGKQISPKVVVALFMNYGIHPDGVHSVYGNVGTGKALIFQNGIVLEGVWEKTSDTSSLTLKDKAGKDIPLAVGQAWFTAITEGDVSYEP